MGLYTEHWNRYRRQSLRGLVHLGAMLVVVLPATALVAVGVRALTGSYPFVLHVALVVAWLIAFTIVAVRNARVTCPRCGTQYVRGRGLCNCPSCGLRMLQEDPDNPPKH